MTVELEENKTYDLILKNNKLGEVAFLGEEANIEGNQCYYLYSISTHNLPNKLIVTTLGRDSFICDGRTISPINESIGEPSVVFMHELSKELTRDKKVSLLLSKLKEVGLKGVPL